jgi:hypothetical protein
LIWKRRRNGILATGSLPLPFYPAAALVEQPKPHWTGELKSPEPGGMTAIVATRVEPELEISSSTQLFRTNVLVS